VPLFESERLGFRESRSFENLIVDIVELMIIDSLKWRRENNPSQIKEEEIKPVMVPIFFDLLIFRTTVRCIITASIRKADLSST
jgi:hypothetical protein